MKNSISYNIPIWNGLKKNLKKIYSSKLEISDSRIKGIFMQTSKKIIQYEDDYKHMTPLSGSSYIEKLRYKKMKLIMNKISKNESVLEIGGGDSNISKFIKFKHLTIVDPSIHKKRNISKNIETFNEYFEKILIKKKYDHVVLFSVIEHVENIELFFDKVNTNLKLNGYLYITTPVIDEQFLRGDFNSLLHEHTYYFTNFGLINLFNKYSLKVINFEIINDCGYIVLKKTKNFKNLNPHRSFELAKFKMIFSQQLKKFKNYTKKNKNIVFYGATNGLNNLIFLSKINTYNKNYYIIDGDQTKVGKYLPASSKKIIHKKNINKYKNICISAQSFKDEIIFQNFNISSTFFK